MAFAGSSVRFKGDVWRVRQPRCVCWNVRVSNDRLRSKTVSRSIEMINRHIQSYLQLVPTHPPLEPPIFSPSLVVVAQWQVSSLVCGLHRGWNASSSSQAWSQTCTQLEKCLRIKEECSKWKFVYCEINRRSLPGAKLFLATSKNT